MRIAGRLVKGSPKLVFGYGKRCFDCAGYDTSEQLRLFKLFDLYD